MAKKKNKKQSLKKAVQSAGKNLSQSEAKKIAKQTGKSVAQVAAKATDMRIGVGAKLANQISSALATPGSRQAQNLGITRANTNTLGALSGLSGVNLSKGQVYQGAYTTRTPATSQNLGSGYGVRTTTSSSQVNPIIGTRQPKTKDRGPMPGPYDGAMDGPTEGPGAGPDGNFYTDDQLASLFDDYMFEYGLGEQQYDPYADLSTMLASAMAPYQEALSSQMDLMSQFSMPQQMDLSQFSMPQQMDPMRMFGAGQNYNIDSVRAAQRNRQRRSGYLRGNMGIGGGSTGAPGLSSGMSIGSALGTLGVVTV